MCLRKKEILCVCVNVCARERGSQRDYTADDCGNRTCGSGFRPIDSDIIFALKPCTSPRLTRLFRLTTIAWLASCE